MRNWRAEQVREAVERIGIQVKRPAKATIQTVYEVTVTINRLLPGLNGKDGLIRQHYHQATKAKDALLTEVRMQKLGTVGPGMVNVVCTRYFCGQGMDYDNAAASFKHLMDAVVKAGIIVDDGPKVIQSWTVRQIRVEKKIMQKMEIKIMKA